MLGLEYYEHIELLRILVLIIFGFGYPLCGVVLHVVTPPRQHG